MYDNFSIHDWQSKRAIEEFRHTNKSNISPTPDQVATLWNSLGGYVDKPNRADIIASANGKAGVEAAAYDWEDLDDTIKGLVYGYFVKNKDKYNFYNGFTQANPDPTPSGYLYER